MLEFILVENLLLERLFSLKPRWRGFAIHAKLTTK